MRYLEQSLPRIRIGENYASKAFELLAAAKHDSGDLRGAQIICEMALKLFPQEGQVRLRAAQVLAAQNRGPEALRQLELAAECPVDSRFEADPHIPILDPEVIRASLGPSRLNNSFTKRATILKKNRLDSSVVVCASDFETENPQFIDPRLVLSDPRYSLYCFDTERSEALFVECPDANEVESHPFYYQAQALHAEAVVSMPFETFCSLAEQIAEPEKGFIWIHSVGECGSTLVSKAIGAVPSIQSIAEPDDVTGLLRARVRGDVTDGWLRQAMRASARWRCKALDLAQKDRVAIKTRGAVMALADMFGELFPNDKHLFIHRNGISWMRAIFADFPVGLDIHDHDRNLAWEELWAQMLPIVAEYRKPGQPLNQIELRMLTWITGMEGCLKMQQMGIPVYDVRYEDIQTAKEATFERIFSFCEVDIADWEPIHAVLARDSRMGTSYDREKRNRRRREIPQEWDNIAQRIIAARPLLNQ
jgi:hypothetical protein